MVSFEWRKTSHGIEHGADIFRDGRLVRNAEPRMCADSAEDKSREAERAQFGVERFGLFSGG
jgi:hypothetical protein